MYHSTLHWKPIANGYSGYPRRTTRELVERFHWVPDREGLDLLRRRGVTHLIVHAGRFRRAGKRRLLESWRAASTRKARRRQCGGSTSPRATLVPDPAGTRPDEGRALTVL